MENYSKLLEKAKEVYKNCTTDAEKRRLESIFPELKESAYNDTMKEMAIKAIYSPEAQSCIKSWGINPDDAMAWLERQCEQKSKDKYTFNSIPRLLEMIEPTDRAKRYCQKLIDSLQQEGYVTDAKIISQHLKLMNGEEVAMATMDGKQGERESTNKAESKLKVGDWVVCDGCCYPALIVNIVGDKYKIKYTGDANGYHRSHKAYHRWTIQDAKDGDIVVDKSNGTIGIFQSIGHHPDGGSYNDPSYCFLHCRYDNGFFYADFENGNTIDSDDLIPATKEQRAKLEKAITEAGYRWNKEERKLEKI